jgi:hypothetical protein
MISRTVLPKMRCFTQKPRRKPKNSHLRSKTFFSQRYCENLLYNRTGHRWQYNTAHALFMLDKQGYTHTHTLRICNTYCFSTAASLIWHTVNDLATNCPVKLACNAPPFVLKGKNTALTNKQPRNSFMLSALQQWSWRTNDLGSFTATFTAGDRSASLLKEHHQFHQRWPRSPHGLGDRFAVSYPILGPRKDGRWGRQNSTFPTTRTALWTKSKSAKL